MPAKKSFFQLIKERNEILWAPCIYDCISARAAEAIGFEAVTISSSEQTWSLVGGIPRGLLSFDEMLYSAERIAKSTSMAVLADTENGGSTPMEVYRNIKRFAEAGIMAVSIEDSAVCKIGNSNVSGKAFLPAEQWAMHVQAAVEAVNGTDCMVIARTNCKGGGAKKFAKSYFDINASEMLGLDEAIKRAQLGIKVGAHMTMIQNINAASERETWKEICKRVPEWKCYPDLHADDGVSDVEDVQELYTLGFQMITCHCFCKGAIAGMLDYGSKVFRDKNTVFTENDNYYGVAPELVDRYHAIQVNQHYDAAANKMENTFQRVKEFVNENFDCE